MKITQKELVEKDVIVEVFCNKCGGSCQQNNCPGFYGLIEETVYGGYGSDPLSDMTEYTFSLCESCLDELFKTFKIPVQVNDRDLHYMTDEDLKEMEERAAKECKGKIGQLSCYLKNGHNGAHQNEDGHLKWYNEDRPDEDQGWMCYEDASFGRMI